MSAEWRLVGVGLLLGFLVGCVVGLASDDLMECQNAGREVSK